FKPLVMTQAMASGLTMDAWTAWAPLAAPGFPAPQTVRGGEILELTLLTNNATKQRIVDYISIDEPNPRLSSPFEPYFDRQFSFATGAPHDITASDVEMRVISPRLSINQKLEVSTDA